MLNTADIRLVHAPAAAPPYERYGRYYLIERIGRGGMAEIFRAVAQGVEGFRRVFVIKRIRPEKSDSPELVRMFCDEARLSALLHHPNVVQVYDFGQIDGTYFLAMEYLRGKDLAAVMRAIRRAKGAVPPPLAARIAQQVATGLHYAHALTRMDGQPIRVVHRDVTPSNIMLQRTGAVKVLDFGIAQATNFARQTETGGGRVKGKLAYLSPEQVRLKELDGRSDVFALGVVLWEMLVGQRLFPGENEFLTMRNVLTQPVPPPSSIRPAVPAALDAIVARALERERESRYATAQEMADELERFVQENPCHSQALPGLLQELFGDETTDHTPEIPDSDALESSRPSGAAPVAMEGSDDPVVEIEALPESWTPGGPAAAASSPAPPDSLRGGELPDRSRARRRAIVTAAGATLAGCLLWAVWRGQHPLPIAAPPARSAAVSAVSQVARPVSPAVTPPLSRAAPDGEIEATAPEDETSAAHAAATHGKLGKKRAARRISTDVTLDPFK